jgi:hypothetical protein
MLAVSALSAGASAGREDRFVRPGPVPVTVMMGWWTRRMARPFAARSLTIEDTRWGMSASTMATTVWLSLELRRVDARIIDGDRRFLTVVFGAECEVTGRRGCVGLRVVSPCFEPRIIGFEEVLGSRLSPLLPPLFCNVRN